MNDEYPPPSELWHRAEAEHPNDPEKRRERYFALMVECGYIVDRMDDLLTPEERADLNADLCEMARHRRRAAGESANWSMP